MGIKGCFREGKRVTINWGYMMNVELTRFKVKTSQRLYISKEIL